MANMLLVNPRKRRAKKKTVTRKRRVKATRRRRRAAPAATVRRRARRNPIARVARRARRRRNPIGLNLNSVKNQVMDSAVGAAGAVVLDIAYAYLPIPATLKVGAVAPIAKAAAAIALGMVASKVVSSSVAGKMTNGALTVMLHGILRETAGKMLPAVQMGEWDSFADGSLSYAGSGYNPEGVGEYLSAYGDGDGMGEYLSGDYDTASF